MATVKKGKKLKTAPAAAPALELPPAAEVRTLARLDVAPHLLADSPLNPRRIYDEGKIHELASSMRRVGWFGEAIARPRRDHWAGVLLVDMEPGEREERLRQMLLAGDVEMICGHRRRRAAELAGLPTIRVEVRELDDDQALGLMMAENLDRADMHPLEEADGFQQLLDMPVEDAGLPRRRTVDEVAARVGRPVAFVRGRLRLAQLVPDARAAFERGDLVIGVALLVAGLPADQQAAALAFALEDGWDGGRKTLRQVAKWIEEQSLDLVRAAWSLEDEEVLPEAGACSSCPKRTGAQEGLFVGAVAGDRCLDRGCWDRKLSAHIKALKKAGDLLEISDDWGAHVKKADAPLPRGCYAAIKPEEEEIADRRSDLEYEVRAELADKLEDEEAAGKLLNGDAPLTPEQIALVDERLAQHLAEEFQDCPHARDAIVKKGRDKGQVRRVCAEPTCAVHGKEISAPKLKKAEQEPRRDWEAERKAQEEKNRRESKVRVAVLKAAVEAVKLDRGHLQQAELLLLATGNTWNLDRIKAGLGWPKVPKPGELALADLSRFLLVQCFADEAGHGHGDARGLLAFAKRLGVDVAAIRKQVLEETKAAAKPSAKKTPAKKKAGKGRK